MTGNAMSKRKRLHIGMSGWNYNHWKGTFYPRDLPAAKWFDFYDGQFAIVEINKSFYHFPAEKTFAGWRLFFSVKT